MDTVGDSPRSPSANPKGTGLASELRSRRMARGMSVAETARRAGITRAYLYKLEDAATPSHPSFEVLDRLAEVLGVASTDDLAGRPTRSVALDALPESLRAYAEGASIDSTSLSALAVLAPFADHDASTADWALVHEILAHTILSDQVEGRRQVARDRPSSGAGENLKPC